MHQPGCANASWDVLCKDIVDKDKAKDWKIDDSVLKETNWTKGYLVTVVLLPFRIAIKRSRSKSSIDGNGS